MCVRLAAHSSCRATARAFSDVGHWGLEHSRCSNSSRRCPVGFRSGLWAGQSISEIILSTNHSLPHHALWQGVLSCWYRLSSPNWSSTINSMQWVKMSLYPSVFTFPWSIIRGPSPFHEKHPHSVMLPPNVTVEYTCWQVSFSRHSPHPNPPVRPPYGIAWFITTNHTFSVVHWPVASLFTSL
jgi:hypothetical protein